MYLALQPSLTNNIFRIFFGKNLLLNCFLLKEKMALWQPSSRNIFSYLFFIMVPWFNVPFLLSLRRISLDCWTIGRSEGRIRFRCEFPRWTLRSANPWWLIRKRRKSIGLMRRTSRVLFRPKTLWGYCRRCWIATHKHYQDSFAMLKSQSAQSPHNQEGQDRDRIQLHFRHYPLVNTLFISKCAAPWNSPRNDRICCATISLFSRVSWESRMNQARRLLLHEKVCWNTGLPMSVR